MTPDDLKAVARLVAAELRNDLAIRNRWLDVAGAAEYLSVSQESIRGLVKRRDIDFVRTPTNRIRFRTEALDDWIVSRMHEWRKADADRADAGSDD